MNKLSYTYGTVEIDDGYKKFKSAGFYYLVDGKKLEFPNYNPISHYEVLETNIVDDPFENKHMVILNCCMCGMWDCDCIAAMITEKKSSVLWQLHKLRDEKIIATYEFDKTEYEEVIEQIKLTALSVMKKGSFYHWKDGSTYANHDTKKEDILKYWKQQESQNTPLDFFEDIETGKLYTVNENDEIISYSG